MKQRIQITAVLDGGEANVTVMIQTGRSPKVQRKYECTVDDNGEVTIKDADDVTLRRSTLVRKVLRELI